MYKRRRYRAAIVLGTVGLLLTVACGLWLHAERRQEALNRQLIAALVKYAVWPARHVAPYDCQEALSLVNAGADPNTPLKPLPAPSLQQLWNSLVRRSPRPVNNSPTAFLLACGADRDEPEAPIWFNDGKYEVFVPLVQAMLQHGANAEAKDGNECTPVMYASYQHNQELLDILLEHGVNINAEGDDLGTPLCWAVHSSSSESPADEKAKNIIRQLLIHGADPNLRAPNGLTPLQLAQQMERPELVALLKQAGAKK
ncbi:MAG: Ankyrin repeat [Chthonomonadaceae bacterium]|nr:Ankyrin repeat [Chthonomonadaceae bacterium]